MDNITTRGIDPAKSVFQLHGVDSDGRVPLRRSKLNGGHVHLNWRLWHSIGEDFIHADVLSATGRIQAMVSKHYLACTLPHDCQMLTKLTREHGLFNPRRQTPLRPRCEGAGECGQDKLDYTGSHP